MCKRFHGNEDASVVVAAECLDEQERKELATGSSMNVRRMTIGIPACSPMVIGTEQPKYAVAAAAFAEEISDFLFLWTCSELRRLATAAANAPSKSSPTMTYEAFNLCMSPES
mmetsp:Transcript_129399/g.258346  ORF Transcript_129399/g.258346 Transcript_129399/m.258346 type:complete len:113 (-) Transcript_129399:2088-2426(-)